MSAGLTTSKLPPIPEHKPRPADPAITSNKTQPVYPVPLGAARVRFTGEGMLTTGMLGSLPKPAVEPKAKAEKNGKGK